MCARLPGATTSSPLTFTPVVSAKHLIFCHVAPLCVHTFYSSPGGHPPSQLGTPGWLALGSFHFQWRGGGADACRGPPETSTGPAWRSSGRAP